MSSVAFQKIKDLSSFKSTKKEKLTLYGQLYFYHHLSQKALSLKSMKHCHLSQQSNVILVNEANEPYIQFYKVLRCLNGIYVFLTEKFISWFLISHF
jgi:hypothetical protein